MCVHSCVLCVYLCVFACASGVCVWWCVCGWRGWWWQGKGRKWSAGGFAHVTLNVYTVAAAQLQTFWAECMNAHSGWWGGAAAWWFRGRWAPGGQADGLHSQLIPGRDPLRSRHPLREAKVFVLPHLLSFLSGTLWKFVNKKGIPICLAFLPDENNRAAAGCIGLLVLPPAVALGDHPGMPGAPFPQRSGLLYWTWGLCENDLLGFNVAETDGQRHPRVEGKEK